MTRRVLLCLVVGLGVLGAWTRGAAQGYGQGKADAAGALQPVGVVHLAQGRCEFFPPDTPPALDLRTPYRSYFVTLLIPDDGR